MVTKVFRHYFTGEEIQVGDWVCYNEKAAAGRERAKSLAIVAEVCDRVRFIRIRWVRDNTDSYIASAELTLIRRKP